MKVNFEGQTYNFPDGTSQDEIFNFLDPQQSVESYTATTGDTFMYGDRPDIGLEPTGQLEDSYLQGRAKIGVGGGVAFLKTLGETAFNTLSKGYGGETWTEFGSEWSKNFRENTEEQVEHLTNVFGWDKPDLDLLPKDDFQKIIGLGVEMMTDPLVLVSKAGTLTEGVIRGGVKAGQFFGVGLAAGVGGEAGAGIEDAFTGKDTGIGRTIGSLGSVIVGATTTGPAFLKAQEKAVNLLTNSKGIINSVKANTSEAGRAFATANTQSILKEIAKAEKKDLTKVMDDFSQISEYFNDVDIPFFVTMANNPVARGQMNNLIRKDPKVRARADAELIKLTDAIEEKSNFLFGVPISGLKLAETVKTKEVREGLIGRLANLKTALSKNKEKADELGESLSPSLTAEQRGVEIASLLKQEKDIAKKIRSAEYKGITDKAKKDNVFMPPEGVETIWSFVKSVRLQNMFGKKTSLDNKINAYLKPKKVPYKTTDSAGNEITKNKLVYPKMSFSNVDSLKQAINFELRRKSLSNDVRRQLEDLKVTLYNARETIPGPYSAALKVADENYYKHIGIPFTKKGISEIDSAAYASKIAPVIVKDSEALQQFLDVVPRAQGLELAKNAMLAEVHSKAVRNGVINPAAINKILKDKKDVVDMIPGLEDELIRSAKHQGYLSTRIDTLNKVVDAEYKKIGDHFLIKNAGVEGYDPKTIVSDLMGNRGKLVKFLKDVEKLDPAVKKPVMISVRREFISNVVDKPQGAFNWLTDRKNKFVIDRIMSVRDPKTGKIISTYQEDLKAFSRLSDKIRSLDLEKVANMPAGVGYDWARETTGIDLPSIVSIVRRPIISPPQKALIIGSKIWTLGKGSKADNLLEEVLFADLQGVKKVAAMEAKYKGAKLEKNVLKKFIKEWTALMGEIAPPYIYTGIKDAVVSSELEEGVEKQREESVAIPGFSW